MSASSSVATAAGTVVVVTHVIPAPQVSASQNSPEKIRFHKQLVALGTVQIMISLTVLMFELVMIPHADTLGIYSGAFVWGPLSYIMSGSLVVAGATLWNNPLGNSSLAFNIVSSVASAAATTIYTLEACVMFTDHYRWDSCEVYRTRIEGLSGVLAGFSFLEFIVSIPCAAFGCKCLCHTTDQQPVIMTNQSHEATAQMTETPPTYEAPPTTPPPSDSSYETVKPLEYNTAII